MKNKVDTLTELVGRLKTRRWRINIYANGQRVNSKRLDTKDIPNLRQHFENIIEELAPDELMIEMAQPNGSSIKPGTEQMVTLVNQPEKTQTMNGYERSTVSMNASAQPDDNYAMVVAKNWALESEIKKLERDYNELRIKEIELKTTKEKLDKETHALIRQVDDLEHNHKRELEKLEKGNLIDRIQENPSLLVDIKEMFMPANSDSMNAPKLDENGQYVLQSIQADAKVGGILARILGKFGNKDFVDQLKQLLQAQEQGQLRKAE